MKILRNLLVLLVLLAGAAVTQAGLISISGPRHFVEDVETPTDPAAPSWTPSTLFTFYDISGNSPDLGLSATPAGTRYPENVNPDPTNSAVYAGDDGFNGMWDAWNSAAYDAGLGDSGSMLFFGGGHHNYFGNGVIAFDVETRRWSLLRSPSTAGPFTEGVALDNGAFTDGTPSPPHTYQFLQFHPLTRSLIILKAISSTHAPAGGNAGLAIPWMYSVTGDAWRRGPENSSMGSDSGGFAAYDSTRDVFWTVDRSSAQFGRFDPNGDNGDGTFGSWSTFSPGGAGYALEGAMVHDPVTDRIIVGDFGNNVMYLKNPSSMASARVLISMNGEPASLASGSAWEWSSNLGGIIYMESGGTDVYLVTTSDGWTTADWDLLTVSANGKSFANKSDGNPVNGFFGHARVLEFGDTTLVVVSHTIGVPVRVMRISAANEPRFYLEDLPLAA